MKKKIILRRVEAIILLCLTLAALSINAQASEPTYGVKKTPNWVIKQTYNPEGLKDQNIGNAPNLLYTRQVNFADDNRTYYTKRVRRIDTIEGAEDVSQIAIDFDPSYQTLDFHELKVIRSGVVSNRLTKNSFKLYRVETQADRLIYNGTVTASIVLEDIRIGDIVEYSYSLNGQNPYFSGAIDWYLQLQYSVPIDKHYIRITVPSGREYATKLYAGVDKPNVTKSATTNIYEWTFDQQKELDVDDGSPAWHTDYPSFQITDLVNWQSVGRWKANLYGAPKTISDELQAEIDKIAQSSSTDKERVAAVLAFVQTEIRYLGIEIGAGGYVPRDPSKTFARRFGDCKDKTLLMVTMLERLGIQADPLLVDTSNKQGIAEFLPSLSAFDHVITHVTLDKKTYFLDGTKGAQIGTLDTLQQSRYGKGLIISPESQGLITIIPKHPVKYTTDITETFGFNDTSKTVTLEVSTVLYGNAADKVLRWRADKGLEAVTKSYLEHYQQTYPSIISTAPVSISPDTKNATITITENYSIPKAWQQDDDEPINYDLSFSASPTSIGSYIPDIDKTPRSTPYALTHRVNRRHKLAFKVPEGWDISTGKVNINNDSFKLTKSMKMRGSTYSETYTYISKKDHIDADKYQDVMKDIEKIDDEWGVSFTSGSQYQTAAQRAEGQLFSQNTWITIIALYSVTYLLTALIGAHNAAAYDVSWRNEATFYPLTMWKFLLLTTASCGFYQLFWLYKNWQWLKTEDGKNVSPFGRTFFNVIMNFSLFSYMSESRYGGKPWFRFIAVPLALLIFASSIGDRILSKWDEAQTWMFMLSFLGIYLLIPAVININSMNDKNGVAYINNSKLTWHSIAFIVLSLPLFIFVMYGLFILD